MIKYRINEISIYLILVFSFSLVNVKVYSQKKKCYRDSIFSISKEEMSFDINNKKIGIVLTDNEGLNDRYSILKEGVFNIKYYKQLEVEKWLFYRKNGKLEQVKYVYAYNTDVNLFKEYFFDDDGNISKIVDYDKGYNICWEEAIEICKNKIGQKKLERLNIKNFELYRVDLNNNLYNNPDIKPLWIVWPLTRVKGVKEYDNKYLKGKKGNLSYSIDGVTGELIK